MGPTRTSAPDWGSAQRGDPSYLAWSHRNQRLEMMDLPAYLESLQQSYQLLGDAVGNAWGGGAWGRGWPGAAAAGSGSPFAGWFAAPTAQWPRPGGGRDWAEHDDPGSHHGHRHGGHGHRPCRCGEQHDQGRRHDGDCGHDHSHRDCDCGHDHGGGHHPEHGWSHRRGCGCGCDRDDRCRCECCIEDADIVVRARCGEVRVVPIEVDNDTRRERDNVTVEVSDVRTAGGRVLPWRTVVTPDGPLTLDSCSTTRLELVVHVACTGDTPTATRVDDEGGDDQQGEQDTPRTRLPEGDRDQTGEVDECVVGYLTLRLGGCVTRPIVVAVAALPDACDSYHAGCSCGCCR